MKQKSADFWVRFLVFSFLSLDSESFTIFNSSHIYGIGYILITISSLVQFSLI